MRTFLVALAVVIAGIAVIFIGLRLHRLAKESAAQGSTSDVAGFTLGQGAQTGATTQGNSQSQSTNNTSGTSAPAKDLNLTLSFGGVSRSYILHVPDNYNPSDRYALMLSFHGSGGTGAGQETTTGFNTVADADGFFVAYPDSNPNYSTGGQWQLTGANTDISFSEALITAIENNYPIDTTRVYVSGFSEGGAMSQALACTDTAKIAGAAVVSENLSPGFVKQCHPSQPITFVLFHGSADPVSPYNGGAGSIAGVGGTNTYSAQQTAAFWAQTDGCAATPVTTQISDTLSNGSAVTDTKQSWNGCGGGTSVLFYTITGGGHTWPGSTAVAKNASVVGPMSQDLNASELIWQALGVMHR